MVDLSGNSLAERYRQIVTDPWVYLSRCVITIDQVDRENPIKPYPSYLRHLELYVRVWQQTKKLLVPKSRRMQMSWTNIALNLWDVMFHEARHNAFVSKKEDDANELIERAHFIYQNIPPTEIPPELLPKAIRTYNLLDFPEVRSKLEGFPQGADQLRQYTLSRIFADEMAFWENAEKMYSASYPTLQGGGSFVGVSSPAPGFFKRLVNDQLDMTSDAIPPSTKRYYPMKGVEIWENPKNGFTVFQLHQSADPAKRSKAYIEETKRSMPIRKYMQEYELVWDSFEGKPVYADWSEKVHGSREPLQPEIGLPLLRGWDFGLTPACIIGQLQGRQLVILREFIGNRGIDIFSQQVLQQCAQLYPEWSDQKKDWLNFVDPSGFKRTDTDERTCIQIMYKNGIRKIFPGAVYWAARMEAMNHFLTSHTNEGPGLLVSLAECPTLVRGFNGGYRYAERRNGVEMDHEEALKDEHSHPHDALQYIATGMMPRSAKNRNTQQTPSFSWLQRQERLTLPKYLG